MPVPEETKAFVAALPEPRRGEATALTALIEQVTGASPSLLPGSMVGFGRRHYRYASGREGDTSRVAFAPRARSLVLYVTGYLDGYADLLERLGPHRAGKGCLYLRNLDDVDRGVLRDVVARSWEAGAADQGV